MDVLLKQDSLLGCHHLAPLPQDQQVGPSPPAPVLLCVPRGLTTQASSDPTASGVRDSVERHWFFSAKAQIENL